MREPLKDKSRLERIVSAIDVILGRTISMKYEELVADKLLFGGIVYHTMIDITIWIHWFLIQKKHY